MHSALALALAAGPLSAIAGMGADENINIYGWQNWSYEFVDVEDGREYDRLSNNAANIGFMAHMDTGIDGLQVGLRCEQFTFWGRLNNYTGWCNRNSKISLRHETMGEIMFGQWLLPYNEIVAQWIDPFYDAGADSHTSIMGNAGMGGLESLFYNGSLSKATDFTSAFGAMAFNRRQEGVIQYVWPNTSAMASQARDGFQFRFAITEGSGTDNTYKYDEQTAGADTEDTADDEFITHSANVDPRIWSTGASWQQNLANGGQVWFAVAYEDHEDITNTGMGLACAEANDDGFRVAGRYVHDWGNGMKTQLGAMWEDLSYEFDGCESGTIPGFGAEITSADLDRDAWMISGKHTFGNGFDFRFSYMDADEREWSADFEPPPTGTSEADIAALNAANAGIVNAAENNSDADAYNLGLYYTMPAGTELRLTYSEVQNEANSAYDFGISGGGVGGPGNDVEMIAVGIVHWFD